MRQNAISTPPRHTLSEPTWELVVMYSLELTWLAEIIWKLLELAGSKNCSAGEQVEQLALGVMIKEVSVASRNMPF